MVKRIFLFALTNVLVLATISIVLNVIGFQGYLDAYGINYPELMVFCAVWGMAGAFLSLLLSKQMAKWMMGVRVIEPTTSDPVAQQLLATVQRLAQAAQLPRMPEVGIYDGAEVNAFATGPSKRRALVAVSAGLLRNMDRAEVEGVIGHEISHIANGDMVTMTLIQGVVNAFVMFFARILAWGFANLMRSNDDESPSLILNQVLVVVFDIAFGILGSMVVAFFSRVREYRADRGGAQLAGRDKMIAALERLRQTTQMVDSRHQALATLKIAGAPKGLWALLLSHPPLEARIARLRQQGVGAPVSGRIRYV